MVGLQLPWPIASLNIWQRMHWTRRRKIGRAIAGYIGVARSGAASTPRQVVITRIGPRVLDHDNLVGGCKPILDALVRGRWLVDDSPDWVTVEYRQERAKGRPTATLIQITEIGPA